VRTFAAPNNLAGTPGRERGRRTGSPPVELEAAGELEAVPSEGGRTTRLESRAAHGG
jgi:hypothetical protein